MKNEKWLNLQLFAGEGAGASAGGEGGGEAAATGENTAVADAGQKLRELGVPEHLIRRRAKYAAKAPETQAKNAEAEPKAAEKSVQDAAAENPTEDVTEKNEKTEKTENPARMSWDEIMADPEYNRRMQAVVQSRLKSARGAEEALAKLTPALELLARKHNLDPANMDYDALTKAISDDDSYYEDRALEMGTSVETAKKIDRQERDTARQQRAEELSLQEQKIRDHFTKLEDQAAEMKKVFPKFDLQTELKNPAFLRMTSPNVGISVRDAYYAVHHDEMQQAAMQATAKATEQKISDNIRAGQRRPDENGISRQAPSATTFNYQNASPEQRAAFKKDLRERWARGEKVYPGQK